MEQPIKKIRLGESELEITTLNARDVISFYLGCSSRPIHPEFVHQNFGQAGKIAWPTKLLPLNISVFVDSQNDMLCTIDVQHGGDISCEESRILVADIIDTMANPCDVMEGCKPAIYPGDLRDKYSTASSSTRILPSQIHELPDGFSVERYSASDFAPKSFDAWKRTEWLMLWFIESVSQSQHETDPQWEYYFLRDPSREIVAVSSVYRFPSFSFLDKGVIGERIRLSQFLTMPNKWNTGIGSRLLTLIANRVLSQEYIDQLSMEDPSFGMTSMRETVYLRIASQLGVARSGIDIESLSHTLKIPLVFARRLKRLLEINQLRTGSTIDDSLIASVMNADNKYVRKFISTIEFFDDDEGENTDGPSAEDKKLSDEEMNQLIREKLEEALLKLEKVLPNGA
jgi:hypothetical protein